MIRLWDAAQRFRIRGRVSRFWRWVKAASSPCDDGEPRKAPPKPSKVASSPESLSISESENSRQKNGIWLDKFPQFAQKIPALAGIIRR